MVEHAPIRGELVNLESEVETVPAAPLTLFGTSDPCLALERMSDLARVLVDVVRDRKLFARIGGREHRTAEAWTTLGGMLGVVPVVVWTRPNETGDGYLARVEARTLDGRVVGAAESECTRAEANWEKRDAFALRSMAQTRAIGRALRAPLGQIVVLAGYEPAGAEELPVPTRRPQLRPVDTRGRGDSGPQAAGASGRARRQRRGRPGRSVSDLEQNLRETLRPLVIDVVREEVAEQIGERLREPKTWLTLAEAAERLGCSPDAVRMRARRGRLEHRYQGRRLYVSADAIERL
jgi:hypothetical protein